MHVDPVADSTGELRGGGDSQQQEDTESEVEEEVEEA